MQKKHLLILSTLSGILLTLSWPLDGIPILLFFAFVPLLLIEEYIYQNQNKFSKASIFYYTAPAFIIWNIFTTYWIYYATLVGIVAAVIINSFLMAVVFYLYHLSRTTFKTMHSGYFILVFYWISMEYFDLQWELSWPWLDLGNGFASWHHFVQWYEYTGTLGGTLWILLVNLSFFKVAKYIVFGVDNKLKIYLRTTAAILFALLPMMLSWVLYQKYEENTDHPIDVVVVQPNNDPYTEQYELSASVIMDHVFDLSDSLMDENVDYLIGPESLIQETPLWESTIQSSTSFRKMKKYIEANPNLKFVVGASTYRRVKNGEALKPAARKFSNADKYYYAFNTALYLDSTFTLQKYYKSKLTPGVEHMPFKQVFSFVENLALDLGGTVGTLGINEERTPFVSPSEKTAPVICYESIYGEFVSQFVKNGAQALFIITNDGWWNESPGHRQHMKYAALRAIETRRSIARSANTGISCFIDQRGDIYQATKYWEDAVIRRKINLNDELTFYVKYGDYIGRGAYFGTAMLLLITLSLWFRNRKNID